MDVIILSIFVAVLVGCVIANISILYALLAGFFLFSFYAHKKGNSIKSILKMSFDGVKTVKNILITFMLIGVLTALWRAAGTIPSIVCYSMSIMRPEFFVVLCFLLNCLVSFLTGTAFGTSATMGAICMTIALALDLNPIIVGGAILSGAYFGDRCSPVSTSALLVSELTKTNLYGNIKNMLKSACIPFLVSCAIYTVLGLILPVGSSEFLDIRALFSGEFKISIVTLIPAVLILILAVARVNVKISMLTSIAASLLICIFYQKLPLHEIMKIALFGFEATDISLSKMIDGGGIISMLRVSAIVCISSSYSGIFKSTGLLSPIEGLIGKASKKLSSYTVILITSLIASAVACNQTLSIMLTKQLCNNLEKDKERFALNLEDSAVVIAPLIPWSIASGVSLTSAGAPMTSIAAAFFLMLLPIYRLIKRQKTD